MKPLLDLGPRDCRWPVESNDKSHLFCGDAIEPGCSYCQRHKKLAYKPGSALGLLGEGALDRLADHYAGSRHRKSSTAVDGNARGVGTGAMGLDTQMKLAANVAPFVAKAMRQGDAR